MWLDDRFRIHFRGLVDRYRVCFEVRGGDALVHARIGCSFIISTTMGDDFALGTNLSISTAQLISLLNLAGGVRAELSCLRGVSLQRRYLLLTSVASGATAGHMLQTIHLAGKWTQAKYGQLLQLDRSVTSNDTRIVEVVG